MSWHYLQELYKLHIRKYVPLNGLIILVSGVGDFPDGCLWNGKSWTVTLPMLQSKVFPLRRAFQRQESPSTIFRISGVWAPLTPMLCISLSKEVVHPHNCLTEMLEVTRESDSSTDTTLESTESSTDHDHILLSQGSRQLRRLSDSQILRIGVFATFTHRLSIDLNDIPKLALPI